VGKRPKSPPEGSGYVPKNVQGCFVRYTSLKGDGIPYCPINIRRKENLKTQGFRFKHSERWISSLRDFPVTREIPYYDELGFFTGTSLGRWECFNESFISSCIATVYSRLNKRARKYNSYRQCESAVGAMLRAATYYALTRNSWFWDRIVFLVKDLKKNAYLIHRLSTRHMLKCDANVRFVYSHAIFQAQWLISRVLRPRDKSPLHQTKKDRPKSIDLRRRLNGTQGLRLICEKISLIS